MYIIVYLRIWGASSHFGQYIHFTLYSMKLYSRYLEASQKVNSQVVEICLQSRYPRNSRYITTTIRHTLMKFYFSLDWDTNICLICISRVYRGQICYSEYTLQSMQHHVNTIFVKWWNKTKDQTRKETCKLNIMKY